MERSPLVLPAVRFYFDLYTFDLFSQNSISTNVSAGLEWGNPAHTSTISRALSILRPTATAEVLGSLDPRLHGPEQYSA